jgi:hypothetical protein
MFGHASLCRPKPSAPRRRQSLRPVLEELEPRLTPAEVGLNDFRISHMGNDGDTKFAAFDPVVAYNNRDHEYLVVWSGDDVTDNEYEIFGQRLDAATGALRGGKIRISDMGPDGNAAFGAFHPAVAYNPTNNEYLVVWQGDDNTGMLVESEYEIYGQRLDAATGAEVGINDFRISHMGPDGYTDYGGFEPAVAYNGRNNEYLVVWEGDDNSGNLVAGEFEIFGQRLDAATGAPIGANDFRISHMGPDGNIDSAAIEPAVAYNGAANEYLVVWYGNDTPDSAYEIFGQRLSAATGAQIGVNDFRISDLGPNGNSAFGARSPAVAYNRAANEYLVVWQGDENTGTLVRGEVEIFGQRLDAATGAEVGVNDFRLSDMGPDGNPNFGARNPAVAYNGAANEYLVVWSGDDNTGNLVDDEREIFGQRFSPQPPPSPPPPPPPQIAAVAFRQKGVARVRVLDAATGAQRAVLTPFRGFRGRLRLALRDLNGDGALDLVVQALVRGRRRKKAYDAVTLAPLPPGLA